MQYFIYLLYKMALNVRKLLWISLKQKKYQKVTKEPRTRGIIHATIFYFRSKSMDNQFALELRP